MYDNIGGKIKSVAMAGFALGVIISLLVGVALLFSEAEGSVLWGAFVIIGGPFIAWLSSLTLYGFGELIEKVTEIEQNTQPKQYRNDVLGTNPNNKNRTDISTESVLQTGERCEMCNKVHPHLTRCLIRYSTGERYENICDDCIAECRAKQINS